ncbi:MAG TPA: hypothetical protein VK463_09895 [Desulfomonilaceae bacterium]|nr:hypothetical protein [Desulfomonilaceae bacterium]
MCMDAVGPLVLQDPTVQELMSNPILDFVHKQVVLTLYSLNANHRLQEYKEVLPVYLSQEWSKCAEILDTIQKAGLLVQTADGIHLTHPIETDGMNACGCH